MISILTFAIPFLLTLNCDSFSLINERPIIGILTEEVNSTYVPSATSSVYASYVKYIESAGGRVVPLWVYKPVEYYQDIMKKINGVLFPGGGDILRSDGFGRSGRIIFDIAKKMNDKGDFFPLWGTCLGFELLNYLAVHKSWMRACKAEDLPSNINFIEGYETSRLFEDLNDLLKTRMTNNKVAIHYHRWCLSPENFTASGLDKFYHVLAFNRDANNLTFVSIVEAFKYPFYGVSFHPEKVLFEWKLLKHEHNTPHSLEAVQTSQFFANFFVNEARKSMHRFPTAEDEDLVLIYNYNPVFTGKRAKSSVVQRYYFDQ